jgi:hypothetical protein
MYKGAMPAPEASKHELQAALRARHELGPEYETAVVESFLDQVGKTIDARVDERLSRGGQVGMPTAGGQSGVQLVVGLSSLVAAVPISIVTVLNVHGFESVVALAIEWAGLVGVNYAFRRSR